MSHYWVNVGDGDTLRIQAEDLAGIKRCVKLAGFTPSMVNAIVKVGHENYLQDWHPWLRKKANTEVQP